MFQNVTRSMKSRNHLLALIALLSIGCAYLWVSSTQQSFGQVKKVPHKRTMPDSSKLTLTGNYNVQINLPGDSGNPEQYFEKVNKVVLHDQWAILTMKDEHGDVTLVLSKESLVYLKAWEVKEEKK